MLAVCIPASRCYRHDCRLRIKPFWRRQLNRRANRPSPTAIPTNGPSFSAPAIDVPASPTPAAARAVDTAMPATENLHTSLANGGGAP